MKEVFSNDFTIASYVHTTTQDAIRVFWTNVDGIIIRSNASGVSLAHEIGHVCGLKDIYIDTNCQELHQPLREQLQWGVVPC